MEWEEAFPDIDGSTDPDYCGEYTREIFRNEVKREVKWVFPMR